jgi:hypothetical protein
MTSGRDAQVVPPALFVHAERVESASFLVGGWRGEINLE